jgi:hypothetical protein
MLQFGLIDGIGVNLQPRVKYVVVHGHEWRAGPGVFRKHRQYSCKLSAPSRYVYSFWAILRAQYHCNRRWRFNGDLVRPEATEYI